MSGPYLYQFPYPNLGDAMERTNLNTMHEQAMLVSIMHSGQNSWQGVLMTRNGVEFVTSAREHRGDFDWRPLGWVYDKEANCYVPPGIYWNVETGAFEGEIDKEALKVTGEPRSQAERVVQSLPTPRQGEKYPTWKSRVYRTMPELKSNVQAPTILAEAWEGRNQAAPA